MMKVNNIEASKEASGETSNPTSVASSTGAFTTETDTTCWTIKLPPKLSINSTPESKVSQMESNHEATKKGIEPSTPDTPPTVTMTISSTTPAEFARRRRIKRRGTGIEDESGLVLSPESVPDSINPFSTHETVDAAFDVILSVCIPPVDCTSSSPAFTAVQ